MGLFLLCFLARFFSSEKTNGKIPFFVNDIIIKAKFKFCTIRVQIQKTKQETRHFFCSSFGSKSRIIRLIFNQIKSNLIHCNPYRWFNDDSNHHYYLDDNDNVQLRNRKIHFSLSLSLSVCLVMSKWLLCKQTLLLNIEIIITKKLIQSQSQRLCVMLNFFCFHEPYPSIYVFDVNQ